MILLWTDRGQMPSVMSAALLALLDGRERQRQIETDDDLDAFMRTRVAENLQGSVATEMQLRVLGLEVSFVFQDQQCSKLLKPDDSSGFCYCLAPAGFASTCGHCVC